jgi:hypothetical protein
MLHFHCAILQLFSLSLVFVLELVLCSHYLEYSVLNADTIFSGV